jgi:hypothetical protein
MHVQAATGWIELVYRLEAGEELEKISAGQGTHPGVLEVRW